VQPTDAAGKAGTKVGEELTHKQIRNSPTSRRSTLIPAKTNVAGMRSEKYFRVSEASAPARVAMLRSWISSTQTTLVQVSVQTPQTASMMSVMLDRRVSGRPRNRANSAAIIFGVAAGGTVM
jgi:hypothetical protein